MAQQQPQNQDLPAHSENVDEELRRVHLALSAVFSPISDAPAQQQWWTQRQLADRYLTSFQGHSISWMVCDKLLQEPDATVNSASEAIVQQQRRFFAAQTLHTKCCSDIHELPKESLVSLLESMLAHLNRYASVNDEALKNRLAMCTSALAVQMGWTTIINEMLSGNNPNYQNITMPILRTLPEECASDRLLLIDDNTRYQMRDHLVSSASMVFAFLLANVQENQNQPRQVENVFKVFYVWIRYVPVRPAALAETPLLTSSIQALTQNRYLEQTADVVVEVLHMYPSHHYGNEELVKLMIPGLSQLPLEEALRSNDEDVMRAYCRVVTEMGESYMSFILSTDYKQASKLVEWVLQCSQIPDLEVAAITFNFWYRMVMDLECMEPFDWRQELVDYYTPHLLKLIDVCVKSLMKYPPDVDEIDDERVDDLKNHRMYVSETIEDCCRLLGGHIVLQEMGRLLKEEVDRVTGNQQAAWQGLESCLACLSALFKFVPSDEAEILPFCFNLIPQLPPNILLLRVTASILIGKFAFWLATRSDLLQPLLPYLSQGLQLPECASAAAVAIKELCECSNQNFALAEPVLLLYEKFTGRIELKDELQILEGVCRALSRTIQDTQNDGRAFLTRLANPIGTRLTASVADASASLNTIIPEIDRLTVIIRYLALPVPSQTTHPFVELLQSLWNILDAATNKFSGDFVMAENICRLHKHSLRSCGAASYAPMLEPLIQQLIRSFENTRQSPFLYAASICITEYSNDSSKSQLLYNMVVAMANTAFQFLQTFQELTNHPDVVEELFYLMGRMMDYCPDPIATSPLLHSITKCAVVGMQLDHQGASKGTLKFLESMISYGLKLRERNKPECQTALQNVFSQEGQAIVANLVRILAGDLPSYSNQTPEIVWKLSLFCPALLVQWLTAVFNSSTLPVPERAKVEFINSLDLGLAKDEFSLVVGAFRTACERERRVRRVAQLQQQQRNT